MKNPLQKIGKTTTMKSKMSRIRPEKTAKESNGVKHEEKQRPLNLQEIRKRLLSDNAFISETLSLVHIPKHKLPQYEEETESNYMIKVAKSHI